MDLFEKYNFKDEKTYKEMNNKHFVLLKNHFKLIFFKIGKFTASFYFILSLFFMQSFFLRQNLEFKTKTFISN